MRKRGAGLFEKLGEGGAPRKKRHRAQRFSGRLKFFVHARGTEFTKELKIVQQHFFVTFVQDLFENWAAKFGR